MSVHYHPDKAKIVSDTLSRLSMGSFAHIEDEAETCPNTSSRADSNSVGSAYNSGPELVRMPRSSLILVALRLVESRGSDFIAYQLDGSSKDWWRTFIKTRQVGSPSVMWT
ncbi:hypothetical protein MTR67_011941 [Solanum verrucosum]|uniref:Uncharacterized protein n=1 Tax=Solanum verrucosum TaxID=315347 RepID=A0AAF0Q810_SOLVR|nr:hypothetical protein MTR67_011941 [Solanum verrucosum]